MIVNHVTGLYPNDTWSGKTVTYKRLACTGGSLAVQLQGDETLFRTPQSVVATEHGIPIGRTLVPVAGITTHERPARAPARRLHGPLHRRAHRSPGAARPPAPRRPLPVVHSDR